ncbi:MAG: FAD-dependent oxidoreductase [Phycisphaerales bacterium]|nr:FAD-dependent oxidoreductase [Phycisphaerales bacterium]
MSESARQPSLRASGSRIQADILIIGAGPAGLSAARAASASRSRPRIVLVDDNDQVGGQIWRRSAPEWAIQMIASARDRNIQHLPGTTVVQPMTDRSLLAVGRGGQSLRLSYRSLILANGARELFLPFPGWTLPGVMGAGGLQAMVKSGLEVRGKRIVVAGSGPLLLAVAAYLKKHGAIVPGIIEQASGAAIRRFGLGLLASPRKLIQGIGLRASLAGVPYMTGSWITRAHGTKFITGVTVRRASRGVPDSAIECDMLACGFGLVPNTQLAAILGCRIEQASVTVGPLQETSIPGIYCAGEPTGIGGVDLASIEGEVAGHAAAGEIASARSLVGARVKAWTFAGRLNTAFALRDELRTLAADDTIICRCEDVRLGRLRGHSTWREAKLQTRCGMGPCQGRICGPIARYLLDLEPADARPPIAPVELGMLATPTPTPTATPTHETRP